jgi:hypothetical protein
MMARGRVWSVGRRPLRMKRELVIGGMVEADEAEDDDDVVEVKDWGGVGIA